ncbi:hypothetical protein AHAS_Ahas15G0157600 [Arachis hypogaea]
MTRSLPDPSLATFDPKIERTLTHIRKSRCWLAFLNSEPAQVWHDKLARKYNGLPGEDPLKHLKDFQVACATARRHGADEAAVLVFAFPFSLEEKAKDWFYTLPVEVRSNWDLLRKELLEKFYPPQKTDNYFCQRMHHQDKLLLDAASGGSLTKNKTTAKAWEVISDLADSTQHSRARSPQPKALSEVSPSEDAILTKTLGEMTILLR